MGGNRTGPAGYKYTHRRELADVGRDDARLVGVEPRVAGRRRDALAVVALGREPRTAARRVHSRRRRSRRRCRRRGPDTPAGAAHPVYVAVAVVSAPLLPFVVADGVAAPLHAEDLVRRTRTPRGFGRVRLRRIAAVPFPHAYTFPPAGHEGSHRRETQLLEALSRAKVADPRGRRPRAIIPVAAEVGAGVDATVAAVARREVHRVPVLLLVLVMLLLLLFLLLLLAGLVLRATT